MRSNHGLKSLLIVRDTEAVVSVPGSGASLVCLLNRGHRFDKAARVELYDSLVRFHDLEHRQVFYCPAESVIELSGRFRRAG